MNKIKIAGLVIALSLVGCGTRRAPPPMDVQLIPNDCANMRLIVNYLNQEASRPRGTFESERDYEKQVAEARQRIWTMRYHCNPV